MLNTDEEIKDIINYINNILMKHCSDKEIIEELADEALNKVVAGVKKFRGESAFKTWVYKVTINVLNKYYQNAKEYQIISMEEAENEIAMEIGLTVEEIYEIKEKKEQTYHYINALKEPDRTIVLLKVEQDKNFCEIAKIFGQSENWARQRFHNARQKIRKLVREKKK